ncbi:uncharacterized protein LOC122723960 [Manihot esculenta]|uniref:Uncharacterized protein n=4 Tax=Manihot esculenta TaxID=3983 RepID=A0ACB7HCE7_MANES|nr:uncharacterized protein LOC110608068 [Manihot esculenta]XP_043814025.1 uncharacterized protein LOC122723960 [Manihot esculenta]KAG8650425.1 hypothetical protein MANES_07G038487v8 [Manihot esculenta]KAG8650434.1 hypothetical protein MANES_07G039036v8 [Manihot esculenta]
MNVLHINYEGSINRDKNIFLDVVCFFKELNKENAMRIKKLLFDVPAEKVLVDDFTITIEDNDNLLIHGHRSFNILEIEYEVSPKKTKPNKATMKVEPLPNGHPPTPVSNPQLEVEDAVPKEDFPQQEKNKVPPSLMEKQEKLVPNGILKAPKVELLPQEEVHNEAAMVKPEMELPAQAEEDNSEDTKDTLQEKKQELGDYFNMSLEEIHQANAFNNIEKIVSTLTHNSATLYEKANLQKLMDRFTEFKGSVPDSVTTAERTQAHSISLLMKSIMLKQSLAHVQEQLRSSEAGLSKISKEKEELDIQIQSLISRKEKLIEHKKSTEFQLETTKKTVSTNLSEQKMIDGEIEQAYENWFKAKEKLVLANASWKLFKECIEL